MDKERPTVVHSAHAHLSGNGHRFEKSQERSKWLKRKEYNRYVGVLWLLCVCMSGIILYINEWKNKKHTLVTNTKVPQLEKIR